MFSSQIGWFIVLYHLTTAQSLRYDQIASNFDLYLKQFEGRRTHKKEPKCILILPASICIIAQWFVQTRQRLLILAQPPNSLLKSHYFCGQDYITLIHYNHIVKERGKYENNNIHSFTCVVCHETYISFYYNSVFQICFCYQLDFSKHNVLIRHKFYDVIIR